MRYGNTCLPGHLMSDHSVGLNNRLFVCSSKDFVCISIFLLERSSLAQFVTAQWYTDRVNVL